MASSFQTAEVRTYRYYTIKFRDKQKKWPFPPIIQGFHKYPYKRAFEEAEKAISGSVCEPTHRWNRNSRFHAVGKLDFNTKQIYAETHMKTTRVSPSSITKNCLRQRVSNILRQMLTIADGNTSECPDLHRKVLRLALSTFNENSWRDLFAFPNYRKPLGAKVFSC